VQVAINPIKNQPTDRSSSQKSTTVSLTICLIVSLLVGVIGFLVGTRYQYIAVGGQLNYAELNEIYARLSQNFDGQLDKQKLLTGAAAGLTSATGDIHTSYLTADDAKTLTDDLAGSFEGIGAELGQNSNQQLEVISVIDDSPAEKADLRSHDLIVAIDDEESLALSLEQAVQKIRGPSGTTVKLSIVRGGDSQDYTITRAKITNPSVKTDIIDQVGYLRISRFGDDTAELARQAADQFKTANVTGVILDVRGDAGGYVSAARAVASLWLDSGQVIVKEKTGDKVRETITASGQPTLKGLPTVVLINGGSASASEIVAGALKDYKLAQLVGEKSYGKGSVQELIELSTGAKLKVTIAKWYTPEGHSIDGNGLEPDIAITMTADDYQAGQDSQKTKALEILKS
jgi:carboxyl-terminal processing protease